MENTERLITNIPFKNSDEIKEANERGVILDASKIDFSSLGMNNAKTTLVYLRNTNVDAIIDFTNVDYDVKEEYLLTYISKDVVNYYSSDLSYTWIDLMLYNQGIEMPSIMTNDERNKFVSKHKDVLDKLTNFIISLPLYAMSRFKLEEIEGKDLFDWSDVEFTDNELEFGENINNIIRNPNIEYMFELPLDDYKFYKKYFTFENNDLFDAMQTLPFMATLMGFATINNNEWLEFKHNGEIIKE